MSSESELIRQLNQDAEAVTIMKRALHEISLCSQNSMSSQSECGRIARRALDAVKDVGYSDLTLDDIMCRHNLTVRAVAKILACTPTTIYRWQHRIFPIPDSKLKALIAALENQ